MVTQLQIQNYKKNLVLKNRFRKYLPVVVDIETGGFNPEVNAILEIAITLIEEKENKIITLSMEIQRLQTHLAHYTKLANSAINSYAGKRRGSATFTCKWIL